VRELQKEVGGPHDEHFSYVVDFIRFFLSLQGRGRFRPPPRHAKTLISFSFLAEYAMHRANAYALALGYGAHR
jgi:hypothetical protein